MADEADVDSDAEIHSVGEVRPQRVHQCSCSSPVFGRYESPDFGQEEMPGDGEEDDLMYQEPEMVGLGQVGAVRFFGSWGVDFFL